jgi:N-acetylmuramoyl-L-alanine amidase
VNLPLLLAPPPLAMTRGVMQPWRVGIESGHWMIDQLPDEQSRLRNDTGAQWGPLREADVNLAIARIVARDLAAAGVVVDLLPATIPVGYTADAFVAIHADGGGRLASGWKVAAPRRASAASRMLGDDIARAYGKVSGLSEDRYGVTFNMRGYYAFSWTRYAHTVSADTPAAIIETGYLTSASDRPVIVDEPEKAALGISAGIIAFLSQRASLPPTALVPLSYPPMLVATDEAVLRYFPNEDERIAARLPAGTRVRPTDAVNGWVELTVQGNFRLSGWMKSADLVTVGG